MPIREEIDFLVDEFLKAEESPRNQKIKDLWQKEKGTLPILHYHGVPKINTFPFTIGIELQMWSKILGFNIEEFFTSPIAHFKWILKMMLYQYQNFRDETPMFKEIQLWLGAGFESSIFGLKQVFQSETDPWVGREPLIKKRADLISMKIPDFYKSGSMPEVHEFYEKIKLIAEKRGFNINFPQFNRGPFGVAVELRGFENILIDMKEDPTFVHELMRFVTDARKSWAKDRADFLGIKVEKGDLWNDEVDSSMISPDLYQEFILPYEKELCDFHGGIRYWHSCANVTGFLQLILEIPKIDVFDVGPWTDLETVLRLTQGKVPIEIRPHPKKIDIYSATEQEMRKGIDNIVKTCLKYNNKSFAIRAGGLQKFGDISDNLNKIKLWIKVIQSQLSPLRKNK